MRYRRWSALLLLVLLSLASLGAVAGWRQVDTLHTRIIFAEENLAEANELASYADEVFEALSLFLDNRPSTRVPVILVGHTAWANGYYVNFPSAVYLYITSPQDRFMGGRTQDWLKSVYTHELTHYLHLTSLVGPAKYLRFLGPGVTAMSTPFMGGWWIEGVTTYSETAFAEHGGRGDSTTFAHRYLAPLGEGRMWSLAQGSYASSFKPADRTYLTGFLMVDYLARHYGEESFARINSTFAAFPFFGLSPAIRKVTGHSAKEIFTFALEEKRAEIGPRDTAPLFHVEEEGDHFLFFDTAIDRVGFLDSPTKGKALVRYTPDGQAEILRPLALDSGSSISLGTQIGLFSFSWVDGTDGRGLPTGAVGYSDLYVLDLSTFTERRLTENQRLVHPAISGDGKRALASSVRGSFYDLVEVDLATGALTLLHREERTSFLEPALNGDGSQVAVIAAKEGNSTLLLGDGSDLAPIVGPTSSELSRPRFVDDQTLFFIAEGELYRYDIDGRTFGSVLTDPYGVYDAITIDDVLYYQSYSPDGMVIKEGRSGEPTAAELLPPLEGLGYLPPAHLPSKPFADRLRFNLALPYPFVDANRFQPGLWFHFTSLLRRKSLVGLVGLSIDTVQPVADLSYQTLIGALGLAIQAQSYGPALSLATVLDVPLWHVTSVKTQQLLRVQGGVEIAYSKPVLQASLSAAIRYVIQSSDSRGSDFFGAPNVSATASTLLYPDFDVMLASLSLGGQARLFASSAMVKGVLTVATVTPPSVARVPLFSFPPTLKGSALARLSASLRFPLGRLDIPIPYGGMTGAGLEVEVQKAFALGNGHLDIQHNWAVGATLTGAMVLGGPSFPFRPFANVAYLFDGQLFLFSIGLDLVPLFEVITLEKGHGRRPG